MSKQRRINLPAATNTGQSPEGQEGIESDENKWGIHPSLHQSNLRIVESGPHYCIFETKAMPILAGHPISSCSHMELGRWGEQAAVSYLYHRNFTVVERNWRWPRGELDIISTDTHGLVLAVEVKTRRSQMWGGGIEAITRTKASSLRQGLAAWMQAYRENDNTASVIKFGSCSPVLRVDLVDVDVQTHFEDGLVRVRLTHFEGVAS